MGLTPAGEEKCALSSHPAVPWHVAPVLLCLFGIVLSLYHCSFPAHLPAPCWLWLLHRIQSHLGVVQRQDLQAFPSPAVIKAPLVLNKDLFTSLLCLYIQDSLILQSHFEEFNSLENRKNKLKIKLSYSFFPHARIAVLCNPVTQELILCFLEVLWR